MNTDMKAEEEQEEDYVENELVKSKSAVLGKGTMSHTSRITCPINISTVLLIISVYHSHCC